MDREFDLAHLAEDLGAKFPEIKELYLFGSRARGTKSTRSDADVLVVSDTYIQPQALRKFSAMNCNALDLFIVDGGKAVSSQNESFIEARDFSGLLEKLGAIKIWSQEAGRLEANIQWRFTVGEGVEFLPSVLPNTAFSKEESTNTPIDPSKITIRQIFDSFTIPQLVAVFTVIVAVLGATFGAGVQYEKFISNKTVATEMRKAQAELIITANRENTNLVNSINNYIEYRDTKGGGIDSTSNKYDKDVDTALSKLSEAITNIKLRFSDSAIKNVQAYLDAVNKHISEDKVKPITSQSPLYIEWEKVKADLYKEAKSGVQ